MFSRLTAVIPAGTGRNKMRTIPTNSGSAPAMKIALCGLAALLLGGCSTYNRMGLGASDPQLMRYARSCGLKTETDPLTLPPGPVAGGCDLKAEVDSLAQPLVDGKRTPGIIVGVLLSDGGRHFYGYGVTAGTDSAKPDGDTLFPVGSLSKGFLADIAAQLVQAGKLSWDDTLEKLLPADTPLSADAKKITVLDLATHTSGLPRQPNTFQTLRYVIQYIFTGKNFYRHFDRDFLVRRLANFRAPHTLKMRYSSMGYALLTYVLELRTGKKVDELLQEYMTGPLGLKNTGYAPENLPGFAGRALGHAGDQPKYKRRGSPVPEWEFTGIMRGAAGLHSTTAELLTYASAHLHPGSDPAFNAALQDTLVVRYPRLDPVPAIAWCVDESDGIKITRQIGFIAGYSTYLGMDVKHRNAVVVLVNSFNWDISLGPRLLLRLAAAQEPEPRRADPQ